MVLSFIGSDWRNPWGKAIPAGVGLGQVEGIPAGPVTAASAAIKFWARRTWKNIPKVLNLSSNPEKNNPQTDEQLVKENLLMCNKA